MQKLIDMMQRPINIGDELIVPKYDEYTALSNNRYGRVIDIKETGTDRIQPYIIIKYYAGQGSKRGSKLYYTENTIITDLHREYLPELFL